MNTTGKAIAGVALTISLGMLTACGGDQPRVIRTTTTEETTAVPPPPPAATTTTTTEETRQ
jgi:hypothetical protein